MTSFFRSPDDNTSSSGDQSGSEEGETHDAFIKESEGLYKVKTANPNKAEGDISRTTPAPITSDLNRHKDLLIHALLEDKCLRDAEEQLSKSKDDPEVQLLANAKYRSIAQQFAEHLNIDSSFEAAEMRPKRVAVQKVLKVLSQKHTIDNGANVLDGSLHLMPSVVSSNTLLNNFGNLLASPGVSRPSTPGPHVDTVFGALPTALQSLMENHPALHTTRYARDFDELGLIGKGGYGKVFRAVHKVDGFQYAVKRIALSPARMKRIQERGKEELDCLLEEVRTLARLDHRNIVRYHHAWLEYSPGATSMLSNLVPDRKLLGAPPTGSQNTSSKYTLYSTDDYQIPTPGGGINEDINTNIVFEHSGRGLDPDSGSTDEDNSISDDIFLRPASNKARRQSHATVSSSRSKKSILQSIGDDDDDDDDEVETIPRDSHAFSSHSASFYNETIISQSDVHIPAQTPSAFEPIMTLNIQMSLHPITLAEYLSSEVVRGPPRSVKSSCDREQIAKLRHCFHPKISLQILQKILKGVQYLHAQEVVHRDLKPANVFLSIYRSPFRPSGCVDISTCKECGCHQQESMYVNPRIGDFGLVTTLAQSDALPPQVTSRVVGTEFYRPPVSSGISSEKLDVFAMGVIAFELLHRFDTTR
ncbi:kinase-like protein [Glonium stellatum]|uniref:Kinase-like protein n=1 Tax=Glonium stellatum TaxID=574774 RepID=A0A8E2F9C9_9PEZI|nr:kinase-like protein [Glonium stellatum]